MSSGQPRPHAEMMPLAVEVVKLLAPYCTRIAVGGSLRRGKAMVGDIEIVCQPDEQALPSGRKGFIQIKQNATNWICDRLREDNVFEPRLNSNSNPQSWGDQQKWFRYKGVNVDLYAVLPGFSWGREMVIRTGPGDANGALVTKVGTRNRDGHWGILPTGFQFQNRELWKDGILFPTPEEYHLFAALDLPYIPPPLRSVEMYQRWRNRKREIPQLFAKAHGGDPGRVSVDIPYVEGDGIWLPATSGGVYRQPRFLNIQMSCASRKESIAS